MYCAVFKSLKKTDYFIYMPTGSTAELSIELTQMLAPFEFVLSLVLTPETHLANKNPKNILNALLNKGFFLQMPPSPNAHLVSFH